MSTLQAKAADALRELAERLTLDDEPLPQADRDQIAHEVLEPLAEAVGWVAICNGLKAITDSQHRNPAVHSEPKPSKACGDLHALLQKSTVPGRVLDRHFAKLAKE